MRRGARTAMGKNLTLGRAIRTTIGDEALLQLQQARLHAAEEVRLWVAMRIARAGIHLEVEPVIKTTIGAEARLRPLVRLLAEAVLAWPPECRLAPARSLRRYLLPRMRLLHGALVQGIRALIPTTGCRRRVLHPRQRTCLTIGARSLRHLWTSLLTHLFPCSLSCTRRMW